MNTNTTRPQTTTDMPSTSSTGREPYGVDASIGTLLKNLGNDVSTLVTKEIELAKAEMREAVGEAKAGAAGVISGTVLTLCGVLVLLFSAVYALALWLPIWSAALVVGLVTLIAGIATTKAAQTRIEPSAFVPERTATALEKDKELAKRKVT